MCAQSHTITICMGSSCFSRGNSLNAEFIKRAISEGSLDSNLSAPTSGCELRGTLCENLCKEGPIVIVDGTIFRHVTMTMLQDILPFKPKSGGLH